MAPSVIVITEYVDEAECSPFSSWFDDLPGSAAARVTVALTRLELGNVSRVEPVGEGVSELKIDFGPGYRIYFGQDGPSLVILLAGGSKKRQAQDIKAAKVRWARYKARKKEQG